MVHCTNYLPKATLAPHPAPRTGVNTYRKDYGLMRIRPGCCQAVRRLASGDLGDSGGHRADIALVKRRDANAPRIDAIDAKLAAQALHLRCAEA